MTSHREVPLRPVFEIVQYAFVKKISKVFFQFGCHGRGSMQGIKICLKNLKDHTRIITLKFGEIPLSNLGRNVY